MVKGRAIPVVVLCCLLTCCERTPAGPELPDNLRRQVIRLVEQGHDVPALTEALDDPSAEVREAAAEVLGIIGAAAACDKLRQIVKDDPVDSVRREAQTALARIVGNGSWRMASIYVSLGAELPRGTVDGECHHRPGSEGSRPRRADRAAFAPGARVPYARARRGHFASRRFAALRRNQPVPK